MGLIVYQTVSGHRIIAFLALFVFLLAAPVPGHAVHGWVETSAGYDDNVAEVPHAEGSGFINGRFEVTQDFLRNTMAVDATIGLEGYCRDYFQEDRRYQVGVSAAMDGQIWHGRFYPGVKLTGMIHRNEDIPEDDANWLAADVHMDALVNARFTLGARLAHTRFDYRDRVTHPPPADGPGNRPSPRTPPDNAAGSRPVQGPGHPGPGPGKTGKSREDKLTVGSLTATFHTGPATTLFARMEAGENRSTISAEAYDLTGGAIGLTWHPDGKWQADVSLTYQRADYDAMRHQPNRNDDIWWVGVRISRFFQAFEVFYQLDWLENDSTTETESYTRVVNQCGVAYLF